MPLTRDMFILLITVSISQTYFISVWGWSRGEKLLLDTIYTNLKDNLYRKWHAGNLLKSHCQEEISYITILLAWFYISANKLRLYCPHDKQAVLTDNPMGSLTIYVLIILRNMIQVFIQIGQHCSEWKCQKPRYMDACFVYHRIKWVFMVWKRLVVLRPMGTQVCQTGIPSGFVFYLQNWW